MKSIFKSLDFISVIKYSFLFFSFLVFSNLERDILPYSAGIYVSALANGASIIPSTLLYLGSFLVLGRVGFLGSQAIFCLFFVILICIYRKTGAKAGVELSAYAIVGMLSFVFLGDTEITYSVDKRILTSFLTVIISFLCIIAGNAIGEKGLKFKLGFEEFASVAVLFALFGTGVCNLISPYFWRGICALTILIICYLYRTGISTIISSVLGISFAIYFNDITYASIFLVLSIVSESLLPLSRYLSAIGLLMADYLLQVVFGVYGSYAMIDFISLLLGVVAFCIIPEKLLFSLKERLYSFRERQLVRQTINRNRLKLSGRLYEISGVFSEMANAFNAFKKNSITEENAKKIMRKQILNSTCQDCEYFSRCKKSEKTISVGISKIIDIGFAKGKLSLIDLPKELNDTCLRPNNILYGLNKLLADFRSYALENANLNSGRDIIATQALGVSEILRGLALETGAQLKYQNRLERTLCSNLFKGGFIVSELLIYGEDERLSIDMIIVMKEFSIPSIQKIISNTLGMDIVICEKTEISENKCFLSFKRATEYDAVYGLARVLKDGSDASGDTHAVSRVEGDRLLIALSDGMGSGKEAENVSSTALSLIESFYRTGLSSSLILNTVNKLLSINTEDSFTALDLSIVDLKTCTADFIKYGSPYGFIISDQGIRIVEGNTLPLGIVEELKPSVCSAVLNDGDMVLLLSDGISDAFGSSGEIIDFLRTLPAKNPQTLADEILQNAIKRNGGARKDDMTALAVRIFKRKSA